MQWIYQVLHEKMLSNNNNRMAFSPISGLDTMKVCNRGGLGSQRSRGCDLLNIDSGLLADVSEEKPLNLQQQNFHVQSRFPFTQHQLDFNGDKPEL